jgi:DHA1 family multidrug resistance protein-like MFS transporter
VPPKRGSAGSLVSSTDQHGAVDWDESRSLFGRRFYIWQINLYSLLFVLFVAFIGFFFSGPFLPLFVKELGVTDPGEAAIWSGILIGAGPASAMITGPFWGRLADRIGGRILLTRTVFGFAFLNLLGAFSADVLQFAVLRFTMGALGGFTSVAMALASMSTPPDRTTRAIGLVQSAHILGLMVGPALGGIVADRLGLRAAFVGSSIIAAAAGVNMLILYREPQEFTKQRARSRAGGAKAGFRDILRTPFFIPILLVLFAANFTDRSFQALVPLFVASLDPANVAVASLTGFIVAGGSLAGTVSANAAGRFVPRFTHAQALFVALIASAVLCVVMASSQTVLQFGLLRLAVGLFAGGLLTLAYGLGGAIFPPTSRASAFSLLNSGALFGSAISPVIGGLIAASSLRGAFLFNTVIFVFGALVVWFGLGFRSPKAPDPADAGDPGSGSG